MAEIKDESMDGLIIYFEILAAFFLLICVVLFVAFVFGNYHPNEAQKKAAWEEYLRKKEEKRLEKLARKPKGHRERDEGSKSSHWVPDKEEPLIDI